MSMLFLILPLISCVLLIVAIYQWKKMVARYPVLPHGETKEVIISIIVAARNEASNITQLLEDIAKQDFLKVQFEVVVIDDYSEDNTVEVLHKLKGKLPIDFTFYSLSELCFGNNKKGGKKQALLEGIKKAKGDIIVTTDADCRVGTSWLKSYYAYYIEKNAKMVTGPVAFKLGSSFFEKLQSAEFAALIGTGAVSLELGYPNMCNGANLSFSKRAFFEVGGYQGNDHLPSGDDEFLLQKIYNLYPKEVFFNALPQSVVHTNAAKNMSEFLNQRKRWSGKWKHHKSIFIKALAVFVFVFHLNFLVSCILFSVGCLSPWIFMGVFCLKAFPEFLFIKLVLRQMGGKLYIKHFVVLQLIYSIYVLIFGVLANFGSFDWKGRKYTP